MEGGLYSAYSALMRTARLPDLIRRPSAVLLECVCVCVKMGLHICLFIEPIKISELAHYHCFCAMI